MNQESARRYCTPRVRILHTARASAPVRLFLLLFVSVSMLFTAPAASRVGATGVTQLVVVEVASLSATTGTLRVVENVDGVERVVLGPVPARLGRNGVKGDRREGNGTTPFGEMRIVGVTTRPSQTKAEAPLWLAYAEKIHCCRFRCRSCCCLGCLRKK